MILFTIPRVRDRFSDSTLSQGFHRRPKDRLPTQGVRGFLSDQRLLKSPAIGRAWVRSQGHPRSTPWWARRAGSWGRRVSACGGRWLRIGSSVAKVLRDAARTHRHPAVGETAESKNGTLWTVP